MTSDNELVDNILEPLVLLPSSFLCPLMPVAQSGCLVILNRGEIAGRRLTATAATAAAARRQILEHGRGVAGQHLLEAAYKRKHCKVLIHAA